MIGNDRQHLPTDHSCYADALDRAWHSRPEIAANVTDYRPGHTPIPDGATAYLSDDGFSGFILTPAGEILGVFAAVKGRGRHLVADAIWYGGDHLDCFDGYLTTLYTGYGFGIVYREPNWTPGGPDVVYLARGTASRVGILR